MHDAFLNMISYRFWLFLSLNLSIETNHIKEITGRSLSYSFYRAQLLWLEQNSSRNNTDTFQLVYHENIQCLISTWSRIYIRRLLYQCCADRKKIFVIGNQIESNIHTHIGKHSQRNIHVLYSLPPHLSMCLLWHRDMKNKPL